MYSSVGMTFGLYSSKNIYLNRTKDVYKRQGRGYIPDGGRIGVVVSTGHNSWDNENIFTYRLYGAVFDIAD